MLDRTRMLQEFLSNKNGYLFTTQLRVTDKTLVFYQGKIRQSRSEN